jgi:hypothetical protein
MFALSWRGKLTLPNYSDWRNKALRALEHLRREQRAFKQWLRDQAAADKAARGQSVTDEAVLMRGLYALACQQITELRRFGQEPEEAANSLLDNARAYLERARLTGAARPAAPDASAS